jgi:hypothetical protein
MLLIPDFRAAGWPPGKTRTTNGAPEQLDPNPAILFMPLPT